MGNADAMRGVLRVTKQHQEDGFQTCIVASACYGVTDRLVAAVEAAKARDESTVKEMESTLLAHHEQVLRELLVGRPMAIEESTEFIHSVVDLCYRSVLDSVMETGAVEHNQEDVVVSLGERLSNYILARYLTDAEGTPAQYVSADEIILTDGIPGGSTPLLEQTRERVKTTLEPMMDEGVVPCVTGFFGSAADGGYLTTFGRGGSDLTAALLGRCLEADEISLFKVEYEKDSEGFLSKWTPGWVGVVHDAHPDQTIPALSYDAAAELAHFGKKVLHPKTVEPAVETGIPIRVRNTFDHRHPGTVITSSEELRRARDALSTAEESDHEDGGHRLVEAVTKTPLTKYEATHGHVVGVYWRTAPVDRNEATIVALVGNDLMDHAPEVLERSCTALRTAGIPFTVPVTVNRGEDNLSIIVPSAQAKSAVRALHNVFLPDEGSPSSDGEVMHSAAQAVLRFNSQQPRRQQQQQ